MHRPPLETKRGTVPLILTGPGGEFTNRFFARGGKLVHEAKQAPAAPALLRPAPAKPVQPMTPWRWSHILFGIGLAVLGAIGITALLVATPVALFILPFAYGTQHAR